MAGGYIKLHRQILDWEWYKNINVKVLFLHLLLKANYKDLSFEGHTIQKGQLVTSLPSLSVETGLSVKQIRGSLEHLISTGEVASETFPRYRLITIVKYDEYQIDDRLMGSQAAGEWAGSGQAEGRLRAAKGQAEGSQRAASKEYKEIKKEKKGIMEEESNGDSFFEAFWSNYPKKVSKLDAERAWKKLKPDALLFSRIIAGLQKWNASDQWAKEGGRFIPNPATWLNGHRWEDEVPAVHTQSSAPGKTVIAQEYKQRDYSRVQDEIESDWIREMEDWKRKTGGADGDA